MLCARAVGRGRGRRALPPRSAGAIAALGVTACFRSQSGPQAGAWLTAIPHPSTRPAHVHVALRRRLCVPLAYRGCVVVPGCLAVGRSSTSSAIMLLRVLAAPSCPPRPLGFASRARPWARRLVSCRSSGWRTSAPGVGLDDRRRLDFVLYGANRPCANGHPHPRAAEHDGAGTLPSPPYPRLIPTALRRSAAVAWQRRWWGLLGVAHAVVSTLLGAPGSRLCGLLRMRGRTLVTSSAPMCLFPTASPCGGSCSVPAVSSSSPPSLRGPKNKIENLLAAS